MPVNQSTLGHRPMQVESLSVALPEFGERSHSADGRIDDLVVNMTMTDWIVSQSCNHLWIYAKQIEVN